MYVILNFRPKRKRSDNIRRGERTFIYIVKFQPQISIESFERFWAQIALDGGIEVQILVKKMMKSNCPWALQTYSSRNYVCKLSQPATSNFVLLLLLLQCYCNPTHNQLALCSILQRPKILKGDLNPNPLKSATICNSRTQLENNENFILQKTHWSFNWRCTNN